MKIILTKDKKTKGHLLDGKPMGSADLIMLLTNYASLHNDNDLELVLDYWVMLKESGHNGFYLKELHKVTQNKSEELKR